jgi:hypothetical protein
MRYLFIAIVGLILVSCGTKVPYTNKIRDEYGLESDKKIRQVQFYTSATIKLERSKESGNQSTDDGGALVSNSNKEQDLIIIPIGTECVFEEYGDDGEVLVRFETGVGNTLTFKMRQGQTSGKYYLVADWKNKGSIEYGGREYNATSSSGTAYLMVIMKKLQKTKRKERVVKGMKV